MPRLVIWQIAEADHKLLHHPHRGGRQSNDMARQLLSARHEFGMRHDLIDQTHTQRLGGIERFVGEEDLHRINIAKLLDQHARAWSVAQPPLGQQRELEPGILRARDPNVGGCQQHIQPGPGGNTYNITFKLKADGGKLTGTMGGEQFEQPIQNGEIHGDDISFTVHLEFGDGIDLKYTGKVAADKIDFKVQRSGDDKPQPFVATKTP